MFALRSGFFDSELLLTAAASAQLRGLGRGRGDGGLEGLVWRTKKPPNFFCLKMLKPCIFR